MERNSLDMISAILLRARIAAMLATCALFFISPTSQIAAQDATEQRLVAGGLQIAVEDNSPTTATVKLGIGSGELKEAFGIDSPARIVIDLTGVPLKLGKTLKLSDSALVRSLRLGVHQNLVRVVIDCQGDAPPAFTVQGSKATLTVRLSAAASVDSATSDSVASESASIQAASNAPSSQTASFQADSATPGHITEPEQPLHEMVSSHSSTVESATIELRKQDSMTASSSALPDGEAHSTAGSTTETLAAVTERALSSTAAEVAPTSIVLASPSPEVTTATPELTSPTLPTIELPTIVPPTSSPEFTATVTAAFTASPAYTAPPTRTSQTTPKPLVTANATPTPTTHLVDELSTAVAPSTANEGRVLNKISFELNPPGHTPAICIRVSQRGEFKLMRTDDRAFDLVLPGYSMADERLSLPQFPTDEFMGITFVQPERTSQGVRVRIGVDRGTRLTAVWRGNQIDVTTR